MAEKISQDEDIPKPEPVPLGATDFELAAFLIKHIEEPCGFDLPDGTRHTLREFYLREAKDVLASIKDETAHTLLESKIKEYENQNH